MRPFIICIPGGGLCNRMRTMASIFTLVKKQYDTKPIILFFWMHNQELNASFDSLFEEFPAKVISIKSRLFQHILFRVLFHQHILKIVTGASLYPDGAHFVPYVSKGNESLFVFSGSKIVPNEDYSMFKVRSSLQRYLSKEIDSNTIGVHIRRTDNEWSIEESPTELFVKRMEDEIGRNPKANFYLATDDKQEEAYMVSLFKEKIKTYKKRSLDRNSNTGIEDALIDLINLSKCRVIFGCYRSSFSRTAAEIGGTKFELIRINK